MPELPLSKSKGGWSLTEEAFNKFLTYLDADRNKAGEQYELLRLKVRKYFEWQGALSPDDLADDVLNRLVRRIDEGEQIRNVSQYLHGIARLRMLEYLKEDDHRTLTISDLALMLPSSEPPIAETILTENHSEVQIECLQQCLAKLSAEQREMVIAYHVSDSSSLAEVQTQRRELAKKLGITSNVLRIRAFRVRNKLEDCVAKCCARRLLT